MIKQAIDARSLQRLVAQLTQGYRRRKADQRNLALKVADAAREIAEHRVAVTKTAPDGTPWLPWAAGYAATRKGQHSLLVDTRELLNSFRSGASAAGQVAHVFNDAPHAGFAQARRPFLGVGALEQSAAEDAALDWMERMLPL